MTSTATREVTITADPTMPIVRIVREFDAPPDKVFRAHADPELVVQWLGPRAVTMKDRSSGHHTPGADRQASSAVTRRSDSSSRGFTRCPDLPSQA